MRWTTWPDPATILRPYGRFDTIHDAYTLDGVPKPIVAAVLAAILALLGGVAFFAVRKTSTEHPPVSGTIPRVEALGRTPADAPAVQTP